MIESLSGKGLPASIQDVAKTRDVQKAAPTAGGLNKLQQQLADQVSLSEESQQALETLKNLDVQLTRFLDVLKGTRPADEVIAELDAESNGFIAGIESRTALSLTQIESIQETSSLSAEINSDGELDLVLKQTRDSLSRSSFSLSNDQYSFFQSFIKNFPLPDKVPIFYL